jgi:hypothetical protein
VFLVNGSLLMTPLFPRSGPGESGSPMSAVILRFWRPSRSTLCHAPRSPKAAGSSAERERDDAAWREFSGAHQRARGGGGLRNRAPAPAAPPISTIPTLNSARRSNRNCVVSKYTPLLYAGSLVGLGCCGEAGAATREGQMARVLLVGQQPETPAPKRDSDSVPW